MQYDTIFFDLDHTLWDFETNSREALLELSDKYKLLSKGVDTFENFIQKYFDINERMWDEYRKGIIDKEALRHNRFHEALKLYDIDDYALAQKIGTDYTAIAPYKSNVFPHAIETLSYLAEKYPLYIITNGFEEVQHIKLKHSKLEHFFKDVITSERAGFKKPDERIFHFSLDVAKAKPETSIMIGDSLEADVLGAKNVGMHHVYFNPDEKEHAEDLTYEIKSLKELLEIL